MTLAAATRARIPSHSAFFAVASRVYSFMLWQRLWPVPRLIMCPLRLRYIVHGRGSTPRLFSGINIDYSFFQDSRSVCGWLRTMLRGLSPAEPSLLPLFLSLPE
jgi:hypothetical protein